MTYLAKPAYDDVLLFADGNQIISSSITLTNDDDLFFTADANSNYHIDFGLRFTSSSATPDFVYGMSTLTGASWLIGGHRRDTDSGGLANGAMECNASGNATQVSGGAISATADTMLVYLQASYVTAGTSGTVYFQWAQRVSNATSTNRILHSFMRVTKIGTNA